MPLFLTLWSALEKCLCHEEQISQVEARIQHCHNILDTKYTEYHYIFALLHRRLQHVQETLRIEELKREMSAVDINLSTKTFHTFHMILLECGIQKSMDDNRVDMQLLLQVASRYESPEPDPESPTSSLSLTLQRIETSIRSKWSSIHTMLATILDTANHTTVSMASLGTALKISGVLLSITDLNALWKHLTSTIASTLYLHDLDAYYSTSPSEHSMSTLIGNHELPSHSHRRSYTNYSYASQVDHMNDIFSDADYQSTADESEYSTPSHMPWSSIDESRQASNLFRRVSTRLHALDCRKSKAFVKSLINADAKDGSLSRYDISQGLYEAGITLNKSDAQKLYTELCGAAGGALQVQHVVEAFALDMPNNTQIEEEETSSHAPREAWSESAPNISEMETLRVHAAPDVRRPVSLIDHMSSSEARPTQRSHSDRNNESSSMRDIFHESGDFPVETIEQRKEESVRILLKNKPQFAFVFRRLGQGSGAIKGKALVDTLLAAPFYLPMSYQEAWEFVCALAGVKPTVRESLVVLRYEDAMKYLENYLANVTAGEKYRTIQQLKYKLHRSGDVRGDRIRLYALTSLLRQRLKNMRMKGNVSTWEGVPEICSSHEFIYLLSSIGVEITQPDFLCILKCMEEKNGKGINSNLMDNETKEIHLGQAIDFMCGLLNGSS